MIITGIQIGQIKSVETEGKIKIMKNDTKEVANIYIIYRRYP